MQNVLAAFTRAEIFQHCLNCNTQAPNCRLAVADGGVNCDAILWCGGHLQNIALSPTRKKPGRGRWQETSENLDNVARDALEEARVFRNHLALDGVRLDAGYIGQKVRDTRKIDK